MICPLLSHIPLRLPFTHSSLALLASLLSQNFQVLYLELLCLLSSTQPRIFYLLLASSPSSGLCSNINSNHPIANQNILKPCSLQQPSQVSFLHNPHPHVVLNILFYFSSFQLPRMQAPSSVQSVLLTAKSPSCRAVQVHKSICLINECTCISLTFLLITNQAP